MYIYVCTLLIQMYECILKLFAYTYMYIGESGLNGKMGSKGTTGSNGKQGPPGNSVKCTLGRPSHNVIGMQVNMHGYT